MPKDQQSADKKYFRIINRNLFFRHAIALVLIVWASLYLPNLAETPKWYSDEAITLGCGQDLVRGIFSNRAVWNTYVNPQFCYQPGYVFLVGLASNLSDRDIWWPRLINSFCALGIALSCVTLLGRRIGMSSGLLIALIFLSYEQSVIHFRWVYAHNATALGLFLCFSIQCLGRRSKRSWQSGCGLAIAAISHPLALHGGIAAFLNRWNRPSTWIPTFFPPFVAGLACLAPIMMWNFNWWWSDLQDLRDFYAGYTKEFGGGLKWPSNLFTFLSHDWLHILATLGILCCFFTSMRPVALAALVLVALLTQNRQNLPIFYYQAVVALPLLIACLGFGIVLFRRRFLRRWRWSRWILFFLPLILIMHVAPKVWSAKLVSRNDPWVVQSYQDHRRAAEWVNQNTLSEDLVICHWNIGWLLKCRTADPLMSTAWEGMTTSTYERGLPRERFRYSASLQDAKYFILTDIDRIWTLGQPNVPVFFNEKTFSSWRPVFFCGGVIILSQPDLKSLTQ